MGIGHRWSDDGITHDSSRERGSGRGSQAKVTSPKIKPHLHEVAKSLLYFVNKEGRSHV